MSTADLTPSLADQLDAVRNDHAALMAHLREEQPDLAAQLDADTAAEAACEADVKPGGRWVLARQFPHLPDEIVSTHRWSWLAHLAMLRRAKHHRSETGGHYTVRRADA